MELSKTDFRSNVSDLTKIPPSEFEKYFQDWMERDDVARSLQAKLRSDLIKNFNKTNLGKHILSHTINSGGSTMRLTLSPLVLALNTLVAEFLYAQNCHFTLSVFCTEVPFRNTLPDFESMRRFRFSNDEISEIWQAVTGNIVNKRDLNKNIIQNYQKNPNMSLLMLIIKCLLKEDPLDQFKRNAEVQTEVQEKIHKSISVQVLDEDTGDYIKATDRKDDNLHYINKYLLILSEKVTEMTKEFEEFAKQTRLSKKRTLKSSRSLEYYALNKSLERITESIKALDKTELKNKSFSKIIVSIENLTKQFCKCAHKFENVTKVLDSKILESHAKVDLTEKQTETEVQLKSYKDWIYEMRNTENGQKFLNKVDISLRKALMKHQEKLQNEADLKIKQLKRLLRLHYQQKLSKHLLQQPKIQLEETRKCNENIERKLQLFERKQIDLLRKLEESPLEIKETEVMQEEISKPSGEGDIRNEDSKTRCENVTRNADTENMAKLGIVTYEVQESKNDDKADQIQEKKISQSPRDVLKAQKQIVGIAQAIAEQGRSVDRIIYDAKLRIQQLENESYLLDKNFQSYLERSKRTQEDAESNLQITKVCNKPIEFYQMASTRLRLKHESEQDDETDEEFQRLKDAIEKMHTPTVDKFKEVKSNSSTSSLEVRNAILEAKLKFFEHENIIRKCREQGAEIRTGTLLQKQLEKCSDNQEFPDQFSPKFISETSSNFETENCVEDKNECYLESSFSEINIKDKTLDEDQDLNLSPMTEDKSQKIEENTPSARRELFPRDMTQKEKDLDFVNDLENYIRYHELINKPEEESMKRVNLNQKPTKNAGGTAKLIKQSMAKVQKLFEQQPKTQAAVSEMVNELEQGDLIGVGKQNTTNKQFLRNNGALEKTLSSNTTINTTTITRTNSSNTSKGYEVKSSSKALESERSLKRMSKRSMPFLLNLTTESEHSNDSSCFEVETTLHLAKKIDNPQTEENKISRHQQEMNQKNKSPESSESKRQFSSANKKSEVSEPNSQHEFGELNERAEIPDLNLNNPEKETEIFEINTESSRTFSAIHDKQADSSSSRTSSDFEVPIGDQNIDGKNIGDDSETDFWL